MNKLILLLGMIIIMSSLALAFDNSDIVFYYTFDDTDINSTHVLDVSGNDNHGIRVNSPLSGSTGIIGEQFQFMSGSSTYIKTVVLKNYSVGQTVHFWFNTTTTSYPSTFFGVNDNPWHDGLYCSVHGADGANCWIEANNAPATNNQFNDEADLNAGGQHFFLITWDVGEPMEVWYNGVNKLNSSIIVFAMALLNQDFWIGGENRGGALDAPITSGIDEFAVWGRSMTPAEIAELYNSGSGFNPFDIPPASSTLDILFTNDTDLTTYKSTFDEGESFWVYLNWTSSGIALNNSVGSCSSILEGGVFEDEYSIGSNNFSLCNTGCSFDDLTNEFDVEGTLNVTADFVELEICHNNLVVRDVDITVSCGLLSESLTVDRLEFPRCVGGLTNVRKESHVCNSSVLVNVTLDNTASTLNQGHIIGEFIFEREFLNHTPSMIFNDTLQFWRSHHPHTYHEHGSPNIYGNCTHNTDSGLTNNLTEQITIVNIPPVREFSQLSYGLGMLNLSNNMIIEYAEGIWNWSISIIDDDLDIINYIISNTTNVLFSTSSSTPILIQTGDQLFVDFDNPFNFTVIANDTFGNITRGFILFNVTDTTNPSCNFVLDSSITNGSTYEWNVICTDQYFFSLNVSCLGSLNFSFYRENLNTTSFNFVNETRITERTSCSITYCDAHTDNLIDRMIISDRESFVKRTFDSKITIESDETFSTFETVFDEDRINFEVNYPSLKSVVEYMITSDEYIHIMPNDFEGWLVTGDYWIDFESDDVLSTKVRRLSAEVVVVTVNFKKPVKNVVFKSIGKLNCVQESQLIRIFPKVGGDFFNIEMCVLDQSLAYVFGFFMVILTMFAMLLLNELFFKLPLMTFLIGSAFLFISLPLYGCNVMIGIPFASFGLLLWIIEFYRFKE